MLRVQGAAKSMPTNAGGETRTHKGRSPGDFKSPAFTISPPRRSYCLTDVYALAASSVTDACHMSPIGVRNLRPLRLRPEGHETGLAALHDVGPGV